MGTAGSAKDRRQERWLSLLAERLRDNAWTVATFYEDHRAGNLLTLSASGPDGLVELHVHRSTVGPTPTGQLAPEGEAQRALGATLVLVAQTRRGISDFAKHLAGLHAKLPRKHNAKRKFIHRVEELAEHLAETFDVRQQRFPQADLDRYQKWLYGAGPMIGVQTSFRQRAAEREGGDSWWDPSQWFEGDEKRIARKARRFPSRFAARITAKGRPRAALYNNGVFTLAGVALSAGLLAAVAGAGGLSGAREHAEEAQERLDLSGVDAESVLDVAEFSYEVGSLAGDIAGASGDCGGIDMPDCDMPDCSVLGSIDCSGVDVPDCGGCDF